MLNVVTGKTGQGKTTLCLERYRSVLMENMQAGDIGQTLWITPTHRSVRQLVFELFDDELQVCFEPGVVTFDQFAEKLLRMSNVQASMLKPDQQRMLLRQIVEDAMQARELRHFQKVAGTSGFVNLLARFISELKREETWPETFRKTLNSRPESFKDEELCRLYERYQDKLLEWGKYDSEGRFWLARELLAQGNWTAFPKLRYVVVDGFTDFTSTQYAVLVALAGHADEIDVTFPHDPHDDREDLWVKPLRSMQTLCKHARKSGLKVKESNLPSSTEKRHSHKQIGLSVVNDMLFGNLRRLVPAKDSRGLDLVAASGSRTEIRETARRVKSLLLAGVSPQNILVTSRDLLQSAPSIEDIWTDAGIPYCVDLSRAVSSLPLAKSMSALLNVSTHDWSYASIKKLLTQTSGKFNRAGQRAGVTLQILRHLNLRQNRQEILAGLQSMVTRADSNSVIETTSLETALETLTELDENLKLFQKKRSYSDFVRQLTATAHELFVSESEENSIREEEASEWDLIVGLLSDASAFQDQLLPEKQKSIDLSTFLKWLEELFHTQVVPARRATAGEVQILNASDARHLKVDHLFVMGLQEGTFPASAENQPFYNEQERQNWIELGVQLEHRTSQYLDEMQFFYRLATRATTNLTLSYSYVSSKGQPQYASPFYQAVKTLFQKSTHVETQVEQLSPIPTAETLLTVEDVRLLAVQNMSDSKAGLLSWLISQQSSSAQMHSLLAAVQMNASRFEEHGFTRYEGQLQEARIRQAVAEHYHREYTFSASQLEQYASCPFQFLLKRVLKIEPQVAPRLETDYRKRGNIVHDLLARLHETEMRQLLEEDPSGKGQLLSRKFLELLQEKAGTLFAGSDLQKAIDEIETELISEWAELYQSQSSSYVDQFDPDWEHELEPRFREISFGRTQENDDDWDWGSEPTQELDAVIFGNDETPIRIEGRIDRIDVGRAQERNIFAIIDYKTGNPPSFKESDVSRGTQLQLALYTIAVIRLNLLGPDATPWLIGYWGMKEKGFDPRFVNRRKKKLEPLGEAFVEFWSEELDRILPQMIQALREAQFPVVNPNQDCTSYCPYNRVCRVNQVRVVADSLEKQWTIFDLPVSEEKNSPQNEIEKE